MSAHPLAAFTNDLHKFILEFEYLRRENKRLKDVVDLLGEPGKLALQAFPEYSDISVENLVRQYAYAKRERLRRDDTSKKYDILRGSLKEALERSGVERLVKDKAAITFEDVMLVNTEHLQTLINLIKEN